MRARSFLAGSLAFLAAATPSAATETPVVFGPGSQVFALSFPFGKRDETEAANRDKANVTYFRLLYAWLVKAGKMDGRVITQEALKDFSPRVILRTEIPPRQVVVLFKGHGTRDGMGSYEACEGSSLKEGDYSSWEELTDFLVDVREKMDIIDHNANLIVVTDACYGGQLWDRLKDAGGRMHHVVFLSGAPRDLEGMSDFFLRLRDALARKRKAGVPVSWKEIYRLLAAKYDGADPEDGQWVSAFYADSSGAALRSYR